MLIDSHSHIYSEEFNNDRKEMIDRALNVGVEKIILPNIDLSSIDSMLKVSKSYPDICFPLMGLHPTSVNKNYKNELKIIEEWVDKKIFYGIGEIGIDLYWDKTFLKEQEDAFRHQIKLAKSNDLPIVIHVRNSFNEAYNILEKELDGKLTGIFHCFSGNLEEAQKVINIGFKLGIGGVVTFKNSNLNKILEQIDIHHLVLETDSPYLAPVPNRGKRNECSYIKFVSQKIAEIYDVSENEVETITSNNVTNLFKI